MDKKRTWNGDRIENITELQRLAKVIGINPMENNLCLKMQDKIAEKNKRISKLEFMNKMLQCQLNKANNTVVKRAIDDKVKEENKKLREEISEMNLVLEGMRREIKLYRQEKLSGRI